MQPHACNIGNVNSASRFESPINFINNVPLTLQQIPAISERLFSAFYQYSTDLTSTTAMDPRHHSTPCLNWAQTTSNYLYMSSTEMFICERKCSAHNLPSGRSNNKRNGRWPMEPRGSMHAATTTLALWTEARGSSKKHRPDILTTACRAGKAMACAMQYH